MPLRKTEASAFGFVISNIGIIGWWRVACGAKIFANTGNKFLVAILTLMFRGILR